MKVMSSLDINWNKKYFTEEDIRIISLVIANFFQYTYITERIIDHFVIFFKKFYKKHKKVIDNFEQELRIEKFTE